MKAKSKPFWQSSTFWFNALTGVATVVGIVADPSQPFLGLLGPNEVKYLLLANSIINLGIRAFTHQPLTNTPGAKAATLALGDESTQK